MIVVVAVPLLLAGVLSFGELTVAELVIVPEPGAVVGIVMSGGNIDMRLLSNVILRELTREGRIIQLVLEIEDRPGQLADIARIIADAGGNVLEVSHNRMMAGIPAKSATLELVVEARDKEHAQEIRDRLAAKGFKQA